MSFLQTAWAWFWRIFIVILAVIIPFCAGFIRFASDLPAPGDDRTQTDAIVVLTGGSVRLSTGLNLLEAGKAKKLFVSGVHPGVQLNDLLKIDRAGASAGSNTELAKRVELGHTAGDTFGNSVETVAWMRDNNFHTMRLVTADYHMRRALIEFRMAAPDLQIVPNPVQPSITNNGRWWRNEATFNLLLSEYGKYLIVKWRYLISRITES